MPVVRKHFDRLGDATGRVRMRKATDDELNAIADALAPKLQDVLVRQLDQLLSPAEMDKLVRAVRSADVSAIQTLIPAYDAEHPGIWQDLEDTYQDTVGDVLERAGKKALMQYAIRSAFTLDNPYTQAWLKDRTATLLTDLSTTAQANIRSVIEEGWAEGIPPNQLKNLIKPYLGLNEQQATAVQRRLEGTQQSLEEQGMTSGRAAATAATRTEAYADDLLDQRALNVARFETIAASTAGAQAAWDDAKDKGLLPDDVQREWVASPEGKGACEYCVALDGERVPFDEPFATEAPYIDGGTIDRPPLHTRCRCTVRLILPGLNDAQSLDDIRAENEQET